jgi:hypothetical protein
VTVYCSKFFTTMRLASWTVHTLEKKGSILSSGSSGSKSGGSQILGSVISLSHTIIQFVRSPKLLLKILALISLESEQNLQNMRLVQDEHGTFVHLCIFNQTKCIVDLFKKYCERTMANVKEKVYVVNVISIVAYAKLFCCVCNWSFL